MDLAAMQHRSLCIQQAASEYLGLAWSDPRNVREIDLCAAANWDFVRRIGLRARESILVRGRFFPRTVAKPPLTDNWVEGEISIL